MAEHTQSIESEVEALKLGTSRAELWLKKVKAAKSAEKDWRKKAEEAIKIYEAEKDSTFNLFHSSIETISPALYNTTPIPDVRRRYGDKDPVAKLASQCTERALSYSVDQYPFDQIMRRAVRDAVVPGRGTARVMYSPTFSEDGSVGYEEVVCRPVRWDKWGFGEADCWEDVPFVYFEHQLDKADVIDLLMDLYDEDLEKVRERLDDLGFGGEKSDDKGTKDSRSILKTITVFEIWDAENQKIYWIDENAEDEPLCIRDDPLELPGFFPVPEPVQALRRVSSMTPICPFSVHKHLFDQLDKITSRIDRLTGQLRVRGLVAKELAPDLQRLATAQDGEYIEANDSGQYSMGNRGIESGIAHFPLAETVGALQQLLMQQEQVKQRIYEATGLSDIVRGASNPNETATAQQIKQQWGSLRVQELQAEVARFARDLFRMKASIMLRMFKVETLMSITGMPQSDEDQKHLPAALQLLKSEAHRGFRIDIESDSTIRADMTRNQEQTNLFLQGTAQYAQAMAGAMQAFGPSVTPAIVTIYTSFARQFKLGKQAEDALEGLADMVQQQQQQAEQQPQEEQGPSPEEQAAQAEATAINDDRQRKNELAQAQAAKIKQDINASIAEEDRKREIHVLAMRKMEREIENIGADRTVN
jgi:hypothetical protein